MKDRFKPKGKSPRPERPQGQPRPGPAGSTPPPHTRPGSKKLPFKKRTARSGHAEGAKHLARGLRIVHEDDDLIVIDKPAGMLTAGEIGGTGESVFNYLKDYVRDAARRRGTRVWIVHRLDKEASGLLVFAKSERAFEALKADFKSKRVHRLYAAVVEGEITGDGPGEHAGTIASYLWEDERGVMHSTRTPSVVGRNAARGGLPLRAITHYRVRRVGHARSLLAVRLESGRKNQIRVHMQDLKHPIVGDRRYGATTDPLGRVCLHAVELGFTHPGAKQAVRFLSEPPGAFAGLVGEERAGVTEAPSHGGNENPGGKVEGSWDEVAGWYDQLLEERGSDHHERVIVPGVLRLLGPLNGSRVLDAACGQGLLCRRLVRAGAECVGVDASERLIELARAARTERCEFHVGDARKLGELSLRGGFDAAACVMALMNIEPMDPVMAGVASLLRPGGRCVVVILHPAFRSPGRTSWAWEDQAGPEARKQAGAKSGRQYRRVDAYLSEGKRDIVMNPGDASRGGKPLTTATYHRPIHAYVAALAKAGLLVDAMEEWASVRESEPGPRASEENRARREIPMFLAIRAVRHGA